MPEQRPEGSLVAPRAGRRPAVTTRLLGGGVPTRGSRLGRFRVARSPDPADAVAFQMLRAVTTDGSLGTLTLPRLVRQAGLTGAPAVQAARLGYGALRTYGVLDEIIGCCSGRRPSSLGPDMLNLLRLGTYQLLCTDAPPHRALSSTADLARRILNDRSAITFVGAVLHEAATAGWDGWARRLTSTGSPLDRLAMRTAHPEWLARALSDALAADRGELEQALRANGRWPSTCLAALPGRDDRAGLAAQCGGEPGRYSPFAVLVPGRDPFQVAAVRDHRAVLLDEGQQLCVAAVAAAPVCGRDERWLELCAGPGAATALLAAIGAGRGAHVTAVDARPDRAVAVQQSTVGLGVEVVTADARAAPAVVGGYDRVLVQAPCSEVGALRRRPGARWRCRPGDIDSAAALQAELVASALRLVRPGGVVGYVAASPHPLETTAVVAHAGLLDARSAFPGVDRLGQGPTVRLWPHRHGTETAFCALLRG